MHRIREWRTKLEFFYLFGHKHVYSRNQRRAGHVRPLLALSSRHIQFKSFRFPLSRLQNLRKILLLLLLLRLETERQGRHNGFQFAFPVVLDLGVGTPHLVHLRLTSHLAGRHARQRFERQLVSGPVWHMPSGSVQLRNCAA